MLAPLAFVLAIVGFSSVFPGAMTQTTTAVCMDSFAWASNSLHQSPCVVASQLLGQCTTNYVVQALPNNTHYLGPVSVSSSNECQCNTPTYSLLAACGLCQNRTIESWSVYSAACSYVHIGQYPKAIPAGTAVPGWALLDVKARDSFELDLAKQNANSTELVAPKPSAVTHAGVASSTTPTTAPTPTYTPTEGEIAAQLAAKSAREANAIIGGLLGAMIGFLVIIFTMVHIRKARRHRREGQEPLGSDRSSDMEEKPLESGQSSVMTNNPIIVVQKPSDV